MKKLFLFLLMSIVSLSIFAESLWFNSTEYAIKYQYSDWTNWMSCNVNIEFKLDDDAIIIYSNRTQIYCVYETVGKSRDANGGEQLAFRVIDQDYDRGTVRLRIDPYGYSQIYVDFADVSWVYGRVRRL